MNLTAFAIEKRALTLFVSVLLFAVGITSFFQLGQLEDPEFTVKTAVITTVYPGASPEEVELEVTDRLELAIQEMPALDSIYSLSRAGASIIKIDIKQEYWADRLPLVWNELRNKIGDVTPMLPPGCHAPDVGDDFSFVYGFVLAVTGDGFDHGELEEYAKSLKKELGLVPDVARVELWGAQPKVIYLDVAESQLSSLGLTAEDIIATLNLQNVVVDAGAIDQGAVRLRVEPTGSFRTAEEIGDLSVRASLLDVGLDVTNTAPYRSGELVRIRDIAEVRQGYAEPPLSMMRYDGAPAIALSLANTSGANIVDVGRGIDARLAQLEAELPVGIEVHRVAWQSDEVAKAINDFLVSLAQAVAIVLVVLTIPMGLRMGIIIGTGLVFTILGTFIVMAMMGVDLQRMSLGALVIALGMMVDNSIVVADGIAVRIKRGMDRKQAAIEAATGPSMPLLGATVVATMAFYPIFASVADAGEYCRTLFIIVGTSLLLSWLIAVTLTPVQCMAMLPAPKPGESDGDEYGGRLFVVFRRLLELAIRRRGLTMLVLLAGLAGSIVGFGNVVQMFFPASSRLQFMVNYWAPQGTRIQQVSQDMKALEEHLLADDRAAAVATFVGMGPPRFYLPVDPELPWSSYGEIIVNTHDLEGTRSLLAEFEDWVGENVPQAMVRVRPYGVGVDDTWKFEARISGPAEADLGTLRRLGEEGMAILEESPLAKDVRIDMRQRVRKLVPEYNQQRARWAVVSRDDIARSTRWAYDGLTIGLYREGDELQPIVIRNTEDQRRTAAGNLDTLQVTPFLSRDSLPLSQVTDSITGQWEDPVIVRWNRRRACTVQCSPRDVTFPSLLASVQGDFEDLELPPGYQLEWEGEYSSTVDAQSSLGPGAIPAVLIMAIIIVALFNAFRPPLIILCTIPFAVIGITAGLLVTRAAFGFVALLGAMSLAGMMIKNAIVLLDEVDINLAAGKDRYDAVVTAAVSRLRPVALAAATTVLGVVPLLQDVFWVSMAVTIMVGLAFGTVLTMVVVPVLYTMFYRVPSPARPPAPDAPKTTAPPS
jgi:multidrug efflux pump subunit AcrB